jgi:hypothetical protein
MRAAARERGVARMTISISAVEGVEQRQQPFRREAVVARMERKRNPGFWCAAT